MRKTRQQSTEVDPVFSVVEAANYAGSHPQTIRQLCRSRELTHSRRGRRGHIKIRQSHLDAWLKRGEVSVSRRQ